MYPHESGRLTRVDRARALIEYARCDAATFEDAWVPPGLHAGAVPGYRIEGEIGRGGMGVVYRAHQLATDRTVALKVMLAGLFASRAARDRFLREVRLAARFRHIGIVRLLESGFTTSGQPYYTMDYVEGLSLDQWVARAERDAAQILRVFVQICEAVAHAHRCNVIHRDLKPGNVVVDAEGQAHVLDFGLSKAMDGAGDGASGDLTDSSQVIGTLRYLAPEQVAGRRNDVDFRTDVHAIGVMLYEALTKTLPFDGASPRETMQRIADVTPRPPSELRREVSRNLEIVVLKALAKRKADRYGSAAEFGADLAECLRGGRPKARAQGSLYRLYRRIVPLRHPVITALVGAACVSVVVVGAVWWRGRMAAAEHAQACHVARQQSLAALNHLDLHMGVYSAVPAIRDAEILRSTHPDLPETHLLLARAALYSYQELRRASDLNYAVEVLTQTALPDEWHWIMHLMHVEIDRTVDLVDERRPSGSLNESAYPDTADAWYLRSLVKLDRREALQCAQEAAALTEDDALAELVWSRLAYLHLELGDPLAALAAAQQVIACGGAESVWLGFEAGVHARYREFDAAIRSCTCALEADPKDAQVYRLRARMRLCRGEGQQAAEDCNRALPVVSRGVDWIHYCRATAYWISGRPDLAAADYRDFRRRYQQASFADPRLYIVLHYEAARLEEVGDLEAAGAVRGEAESVLATSLQRAPPTSVLARSLRCLHGELTPDALAGGADANSPYELCEAYYYAGEACRLAGDLDGGREWFRRCVELDLPLDVRPFPPKLMNESILARWRLRTPDERDAGAQTVGDG